jgi:hypothetical protein
MEDRKANARGTYRKGLVETTTVVHTNHVAFAELT